MGSIANASEGNFSESAFTYRPAYGKDLELSHHFSSSDVLEMYRMLHIVGRVLDAAGIRWWVSHGTLLGALRDQGFSAHFNDAEIDILHVHLHELQSLDVRSALARNGYELSFGPRHSMFKVCPAGTQDHTHQWDADEMYWWLPQRHLGYPCLDIYWLKNPRLSKSQQSVVAYATSQRFHDDNNYFWYEDEIANLTSARFGESYVWVPVGAASHLDRAYGKDWNFMVRPHYFESLNGGYFEPFAVSMLTSKRASPVGPLPPTEMIFLPHATFGRSTAQGG